MKALGVLESAEKFVARVFLVTGFLCLVGIVLTIVLNVVMRIDDRPLMWYLELCSVFVVWLAFVPLGANYLLNRHFIIDTFVHYLPAKLRPIQLFVVDVISLGCVALLAVSAVDATVINGDMLLNTIPMPISIASYLPVVVGAVSYFLLILSKYVKFFLRRRDERAS